MAAQLKLTAQLLKVQKYPVYYPIQLHHSKQVRLSGVQILNKLPIVNIQIELKKIAIVINEQFVQSPLLFFVQTLHEQYARHQVVLQASN